MGHWTCPVPSLEQLVPVGLVIPDTCRLEPLSGPVPLVTLQRDPVPLIVARDFSLRATARSGRGLGFVLQKN